MRQLLALVGVAAIGTALLSACGGGGADRPEVGARKAACNSSPNLALRSPSQAPAPAPAVGQAAASASLASLQPAALPPEPVEELLPQARFVVQAQVARVVYQGPKPPKSTHRDVAGPLPPERCQVVQLDVTRVLTGDDPGSSVTVVKPLAPYLLKTGQDTTDVAFLVRAGDPFPIILGRYGPYPIADVQAALSAGQ
jgi:hypothetical protein